MTGDTMITPPIPEHGVAGHAAGGGTPSPAIIPRLLTDLIDRAVQGHPTRTAIDFLGRTWTYGEIGDLVDRAARGLQDIGVNRGTRLGLCLPNTPYFVILYFAALKCGATIVNFNPLYVEHELRHQIRDSGTTVMAVPDLKMIHSKVLAVAAETGLQKIIVCPMADILPRFQSLGFRLFKRADHAIAFPQKSRAAEAEEQHRAEQEQSELSIQEESRSAPRDVGDRDIRRETGP